MFRRRNTIVTDLKIALRAIQLKSRLYDVLEILSHTSSTQGPTMAGHGGKFSNLRPSDASKMLFWNYFLYIKYRKLGAI